jgi:hypothetical protein
MNLSKESEDKELFSGVLTKENTEKNCKDNRSIFWSVN